MAIVEISEFRDILSAKNGPAQVPDGAPTEVTQLDNDDEFTADTRTRLIRVKPVDDQKITITWANGQAETFDGPEFRGARPNDFPIVVTG